MCASMSGLTIENLRALYGLYHSPAVSDADFNKALVAPCVCGDPMHTFYNSPNSGGWCLYNPKRDGLNA